MGEVVRLPGDTMTLQAAVEAFLEHQDLARSTRRVYGASLASLVAELGPATAVGELSGQQLAGWFRDRHHAAAPATWNVHSHWMAGEDPSGCTVSSFGGQAVAVCSQISTWRVVARTGGEPLATAGLPA